MSDELIVSGGTSVDVTTGPMYTTAERLAQLATEASEVGRVVATLGTLPYSSSAPRSVWEVELELEHAIALLARASTASRVLATALTVAAEGYERGEQIASRLMASAIDEAAGALGVLAPLLLPGALASIVGIVLASPDTRRRTLSNPAVVAAIRAAVSGADDALLARWGIPRTIVRGLGDQGLRVVGVPTVAAGVALVGRGLGMVAETPTRVSRSTSLRSPVVAPSGFADRLARVPDPEALAGAQVVIEKYEMPGGEVRAEVYIAGTVDFDPFAEGEPWDMASNLSNAVGPGGGSYRAVVDAMAEAGLSADTPVQLTGYSQGGGTAAQLAASGEFDVRGLVTFGGPTGQVAVPDTVPTVIVEHSDDLVAALGGLQANDHAVVVERWATEGGELGSEILPGHARTAYRDTAALMDVSDDPALRDVASTIGNFTAGGTLLSRVAYECDRVSDGR